MSKPKEHSIRIDSRLEMIEPALRKGIIFLIIRCAICNKKLGVYKGKTFFIQHARDSSKIVCQRCWKRIQKKREVEG
jgi:hypothetical protein